jgi:hypothetical protein
MKNKLIIIPAVVAVLLPKSALAHCPLCTAGAGAAALGAAWLGVGQMPIGIFIGAFAVALGLWVARLIKREYIPHQKWFLSILSYVTIVLPLTPILRDVHSIYVGLGGEYGSMTNRVYMYNDFIVGSVIGAFIIVIAPSLSRRLTDLRGGKLIPYQGMMITFVLLLLSAATAELLT